MNAEYHQQKILSNKKSGWAQNRSPFTLAYEKNQKTNKDAERHLPTKGNNKIEKGKGKGFRTLSVLD
jgi:hypothetical protein